MLLRFIFNLKWGTRCIPSKFSRPDWGMSVVCGIPQVIVYPVLNMSPQLASARKGRSTWPKVVIVSLAFPSPTTAAFRRNASAPSGCIQANYDGYLCFYPVPSYASTASGHNKKLIPILNQHVGSPPVGGASIAYCNLMDRTFLDDGRWPLRGQQLSMPVAGIAVCYIGGINGSNKFLTTCRIAYGDDDHEARTPPRAECARVHKYGKALIEEGCSYEPYVSLLEISVVVFVIAAFSL
ncbi:hypothetical protein BKA62DRAFT_677703 [Auriculariales sp. MPI-PUGE-AT-0066]|nr:hypothetical protein BKA62DRAFT_677703 [Auriculariales sp. MPI-PUGE-AT-0066]